MGKELIMVKERIRARGAIWGMPLTKRQSCWIQRELITHNIPRASLAQKAQRTDSTVSRFFLRFNNSYAILKAAAELLGYVSYEEMLLACQDSPICKICSASKTCEGAK
jgi:hypothetical protein